MKIACKKPVHFCFLATRMQRRCAIFALLICIGLCDYATAFPQEASKIKTPVAVEDTGEMWNSISDAALKTEAVLKQPPTPELLMAETFFDVINALTEMKLAVHLTRSATDDALTLDEEWEVIENSNETGTILKQYLTSRNAVLSITKKGVIEIISMDEMTDVPHFQTVIYRVDRLVQDESELRALSEQIQNLLMTDEWADSGSGEAVMLPRLQSGHRLLIVSIHYQGHVKLREFLQDLSGAVEEPRADGDISATLEDKSARPSSTLEPYQLNPHGLSGSGTPGPSNQNGGAF